MVKYTIRNKGSEELFQRISDTYGVSKVVARLMVNREVPFEEMGEYIRPDINKLYNPYLLKDIRPAAELIKQAVDESKKIRVIGDYDIDGVMSTYILVDGLRSIGGNVDYQIPHRIEDGYGLNANIIRTAIDDKVDIIITCDNGVSAVDEIALARENGIDVVITDHHEMMHDKDLEIRPNANYLINPKREGDQYPFKKLCGAVVAWKLITVLFDISGVTPHLVKDSEYMAYEGGEDVNLLLDDKTRSVMNYLEYAAFATIGDVMELVGENRIIVKFGLEMLSNTNNLGLASIIRNKLDAKKTISTYDIGFIIGPCINASGRLDTADKSLRLLLSEDLKEIDELTQSLVQLNDERKDMTDEGVDEAVRLVESTMPDDKVLVLYIPALHESVAGIVAGRLRERFFKPTIVLCDGEECVKGSGRSIENYNMYEALCEVKDLFIKFGGHPMAAGMSLDMANVDSLRERLNNNCSLASQDFIDCRSIDMTMNLCYISIDMIEELEMLEPFGNGNKKPLFAKKDADVISIRRIAGGKYLKFEFMDENKRGTITGLYFQDADELEKRLIEAFGQQEYDKALVRNSNNISIKVMFYPQINEFRGEKSAQIVILDVLI